MEWIREPTQHDIEQTYTELLTKIVDRRASEKNQGTAIHIINIVNEPSRNKSHEPTWTRLLIEGMIAVRAIIRLLSQLTVLPWPLPNATLRKKEPKWLSYESCLVARFKTTLQESRFGSLSFISAINTDQNPGINLNR